MGNKFARPLLLLIILALNGCAAPPSSPGPGPAGETRREERRYVNAEALNLRSCPGVQCRIIRALRLGESCVVVRESSGWAEIVTSGRDSVTGWVAMQYLSAQPVAGKPRARKGGKKSPSTPALPAEEFSPPAASPPLPAEEMAPPGGEAKSPPAAPLQEEFAK